MRTLLRPYNAATVVRLPIRNGNADKFLTAVPPLGMIRYQIDNGVMTDFPLANLSIDAGERVVLAAVDAAWLQCQDFTITWQDDVNLVPVLSADAMVVETYGNALAKHPQLGVDVTSSLAAIAGYIDTEVAAIKAVTDGLVANGTTTRTIAQEVLLVLLMGRGNRVALSGGNVVGYDTDGSTVISSQPFTRLPASANPVESVG